MMNFQLLIIVHFSKEFFMKTEKKKNIFLTTKAL